MKNMTRGICTALILVGALSQVAVADEFVMATGAKEPYANESGTGFLDQIAKEVFSRVGHNAKVMMLPTKRAIVSANQGSLDGDMQRIAGLEKNFPNLIRIDEPVSTYQFTAFSLKEDEPAVDFTNLKGKTVGYLRGWKFYDKNVPKDVKIVIADSPAALMRLLKAYRIDLALFSKWSGVYWARREGVSAHPVSPSLMEMKMYMYVHRKHEDMADNLAKALKSSKDDGSYQKIFETTLNKDRLM